MEQNPGNRWNPQMGQAGNPSTPDQHSKRIYILAAIVILVLAGLVLTYVNKQGTSPKNEQRTDAPPGEVVANFPKELLLEEGVIAKSSYSLEYKDNGASLPVVEYISQKELPILVSMYSKYLLDADWSVSRFGDPDEYPSTYFNAAKEAAEVNIILTEGEEEGTTVRISYLSN